MTHNFKIGDRVRVHAFGMGSDQEGLITDIDDDAEWPITVMAGDEPLCCWLHELELIESDHGEFLVLCHWDGGQDHITYTNLSKATEVAESRAASWPGKEFTVYRAVSRSMVNVLPVKTTPL